MTLNGALAGMISMCAGCDRYNPWSAMFIGSVGGLLFLTVSKVMLR